MYGLVVMTGIVGRCFAGVTVGMNCSVAMSDCDGDDDASVEDACGSCWPSDSATRLSFARRRRSHGHGKVLCLLESTGGDVNTNVSGGWSFQVSSRRGPLTVVRYIRESHKETKRAFRVS